MDLLYFKNKRGKVVAMTELGFSRLSEDQRKELKKYSAPKKPNVLKKTQSDES